MILFLTVLLTRIIYVLFQRSLKKKIKKDIVAMTQKKFMSFLKDGMRNQKIISKIVFLKAFFLEYKIMFC